jgi:hypothetical protein
MTGQPKSERVPATKRALADLAKLEGQINKELSEQPRPKYYGLFEGMAQWWLDHLDAAPAVVIRCGYRDPEAPNRECRNAIGEVKTEGDRVLAMSKNEYPEITTEWTPLAAPTLEELAAEIAEREAQVLRYTGTGPGDGSIVYKRTPLPREVAPVEDLTLYVCRVHGEVEVDTAELAAFVRETLRDTPTVTRTYCPNRDVD